MLNVTMAESALTCSICFEAFCNPKIIPCFHTFCRDCVCAHVERNLKKGKFNCPVCRAVIEMPKNGVDGFQSNFYINELTKSMTAQPVQKEKEELSLSEADLKVGRCPEHGKEMLTMYCEQCNVPCCRDCKIESHDGHISVKLVAMTKKLFDEAGDLLTLINIKTERTQNLEVDLHSTLETVKSERARFQEQLANRKTVVVEKVENEAKIAVKSLSEFTKAASDNINDSIEKIKTAKDELVEITESLTQKMKLKDPLLLLRAIPVAKEKVDSINTRINIDRLFPGIIIQKSDEPIDSHVRRAVGEVVIKKYPNIIKGNLENAETIDTDIKDKTLYVKTVLPVSKTEAWIALRSRKESNTQMRKLNTNGNVLISFRLSGLINSMTCLLDGKVAVSMPIENKVCLIEGERNVYELAGVRNPMGIASYGEELFVCSLESKELKEIKPHSVNRIVVLSKEGMLKRTIEFSDGNPLFSFPGKICVSYSGDIIVSDFARNTIVCIGVDGRPKYQYSGGEEFLCAAVFCDDAGHILVETSEGMHVLDDNFKLIIRYTTEFPVAHSTMAVGPNGLIWVADKDCVVTTWKYMR